MRVKLLAAEGEKTYVLVFKTGDKVVETLSSFARKRLALIDLKEDQP